jgi:hypothetical protein
VDLNYRLYPAPDLVVAIFAVGGRVLHAASIKPAASRPNCPTSRAAR